MDVIAPDFTLRYVVPCCLCCSTLSLSELVEALAAYSCWPPARRPPMPHAWAEAFLAATQQHLQAAVPVTVRSQQQPAAAAAEEDEEAAELSSEAWPGLLVQLVQCIPQLPVLPAMEWHSVVVLAIVGQLSSFTSQQAAKMLRALAGWKAAMTASLAALRNSSEAEAAAEAAFAPSVPLYDVLMYRAAAGGCIVPEDVINQGGVTLAAVQALPAALRELSWPPDEGLVQQMLAYIGQYRQQAVLSTEKLEKAAQGMQKKLQAITGTISVSSGSSSNAGGGDSGAESSNKHIRKQPQQKAQQQLQQLLQQQARLQDALQHMEGMAGMGSQHLQHVDAITEDWEQLLQQAGELSNRVAALESISRTAAFDVAASTAGSAMQQQAVAPGADEKLAGSTGLDVDHLMAGMMQAAGMPQSTRAAAASSDTARVLFDSTAFSDLDDALGGLSEPVLGLPGSGAAVWVVSDEVDEQEIGGDDATITTSDGTTWQYPADEGYIDTVAEDI